MIMLIPVEIMVVLDHENEDITTNYSLIRLIVGGKTRLVRLAKSYQVTISERSLCNPWARIIVQLCTHLYFEFSRQNSIDDVRLWVIIRVVTPM